MEFNGQCVMVTGAGQGLGAAFAKAFAARGAKVALVGRTLEKLESVRDGISQSGGIAQAFACDISHEKSVVDLMQAVKALFGPVTILINNAAYHKSTNVVDTSLELWERQIQTNLTGTFLCSKAVLPSMLERRYGKIVNISSSAAKHFFPGFGAYAASKGGIVSFTHTLSEEVKHQNINVNAIYLGMTNTEHTQERLHEDKAITIPLEAMLSVEDVVPVVLFLASDDSRAIMGAAIDVFGRKS
jgi:NAD(P)-dependent dehydrogenase (short-subunit alcohol dehydrogenase family)